MDSDRKIRVLIVDDYDLVREGLTALFEAFEDFDVVGTTGDGRTVLALCSAYQPDVVLMDMIMPYSDSVEITRCIRCDYPHIQVVILSMSSDPTRIYNVLQAGAMSYLSKAEQISEVTKAVRDAVSGISTLSPEAVAALIEAKQQKRHIGFDLTHRQQEVLTLMVDGLSTGEIAKRLVLSPATVKNHITGILLKLGVSNRTKAVALALQHHLVTKVGS